MKLIDMQIKEFIEILASDAPAPGGGSASALAGAQGVALFMMVANLTVGKAKYAEFEELCKETLQKGKVLLEALTDSIDKDTEAFNQVSAAYKMPKETPEEKQLRSAKIAEAMLTATQVPFDVMSLSLDALKLTKVLIGKSNANAASDLGVAGQSLLVCLKGAWLNVKINLSSIKVAEKAELFQREGEQMMIEAERLAREIYEEVLGSL